MTLGYAEVYEYDTRPEAPLDSAAIRHLVRPGEPDATLCDEFIDTQFGTEPADQSVYCGVCDSMAYNAVKDAARSEVARELGVDEGEVF